MAGYDRPVYGNVHVYDYEHSGDSRQAYMILNRFGITDRTFQYNGDGNVAFIEFTTEFTNAQRFKTLASELERAGYGIGFVNLDDYTTPAVDYKSRVAETLPLTDTSLKEMIESLPKYDEVYNRWLGKRRLDDWNVYVSIGIYKSAINRDPSLLTAWVETFRRLGCESVAVFTEDRLEITLQGIGRFAKVLENKAFLLDEKARCNTPLLNFCRQCRDWRDDMYDCYSLKYMQHSDHVAWQPRFKYAENMLEGWWEE